MKHLVLLASVYAVVAALVLPGTLFAQESAEAPATEPAPAESGPSEPPQPEPEPAPVPAEPVPPATPPAAPAPETEPAPEPSPPEPQFLADERKEREPSARAAARGSVTIVDFSFSPGTITINQGDTVTWVNNGPTPHSATASGGSFDTGIFPAGQSRSHTFDEAGTFAYICTPHPQMRGTVVVQASQSGGDTPDSSEGSGATGGTGGGTAGAEAAQSDGGPTLPNSGAEAGALLVLGALMLLLGVAVHRRARGEQTQPAGRIGW
jgi:plastocyanin